MEKLKKIRTKNNYTYKHMQELLNVSKTYYWQLENEKRRLTYEQAINISKVFNLKPDDILYDAFSQKKK